jgi:3'-5' exoribonuclease
VDDDRLPRLRHHRAALLAHAVVGADEVAQPQREPRRDRRVFGDEVAHHGMREKGSPVVPQTREAIIVHYCDDMTARIGAIDDAEAAAPAGERWTNRIFMIDAPAYLGPRDEPPEE